jgi:hypothetical protein
MSSYAQGGSLLAYSVLRTDITEAVAIPRQTARDALGTLREFHRSGIEAVTVTDTSTGTVIDEAALEQRARAKRR